MRKKLIVLTLAVMLANSTTVAANNYEGINAGVSRTIAEDVAKAVKEAKECAVTKETVEPEEPTIASDELELLAKCVEAEAATEGLKGKQLVVDVILNRVDSPEFSDSITGVITEHNQFSTWANGMIAAAEPTAETYDAIELELESRLDYDILYFTAGSYNPYCIPAYQYKNHYFGY